VTHPSLPRDRRVEANIMDTENSVKLVKCMKHCQHITEYAKFDQLIIDYIQ